MPGVEEVISQCEKFLGTVGRPNEATRWYAARNGAYFANAAWCDMFITWAAHQSGNYNVVNFGKDFAYTVWHAQEFQKHGQWNTDTAGIRRGDIVFFDWAGTNSIAHIDHVGIVTDVNGRDVLTIEGNTSDRCARRVRRADTIVGYGRPAYAQVAVAGQATYTVKAGDTLSRIGAALGVRWQDIAALNGLRDPYVIQIGQVLKVPGEAPAPAPAPEEAPVARPQVSLTNLQFGDRHADVGVFQTALKNKGYSPGVIDSWFGNQTKEACRKFQVAQNWAGSDGIPGPMTVDRLGLALRTSPEPSTSVGEPPADYKRVTWGGKTINVRTRVMLEAANARTTADVTRLSQGSYNRGVSASAGTHDGGGVVDIPSTNLSLLKVLREVGFAAWIRTSAEGFSPHIHAVAIGDRELAPGARNQVTAYFNGRNGLANGRADTAPASVGRPYPAWAAKYR